MQAALTAEATAEAQLCPFLSPPSPCLQCGVIHTFTYKTASPSGPLTYEVQLAPINGATTSSTLIRGYAGGACDKETLQNFSGVCYAPFYRDGHVGGSNPLVPGVTVALNLGGNGNRSGGSGSISVNCFTRPRSSGRTVRPITPSTVGLVTSKGLSPHWAALALVGVITSVLSLSCPRGVRVTQVIWSNVDPNGETTTAVWNV